MLGKRKHLIRRNNEMIQHPHINQSQRLFQYLRQMLVGLACLGNPARMIMRKQ